MKICLHSREIHLCVTVLPCFEKGDKWEILLGSLTPERCIKYSKVLTKPCFILVDFPVQQLLLKPNKYQTKCELNQFMLARLPIINNCMCQCQGYYTIIDFNEVDIRIYLPEKVIIHRGR